MRFIIWRTEIKLLEVPSNDLVWHRHYHGQQLCLRCCIRRQYQKQMICHHGRVNGYFVYLGIDPTSPDRTEPSLVQATSPIPVPLLLTMPPSCKISLASGSWDVQLWHSRAPLYRNTDKVCQCSSITAISRTFLRVSPAVPRFSPRQPNSSSALRLPRTSCLEWNAVSASLLYIFYRLLGIVIEVTHNTLAAVANGANHITGRNPQHLRHTLCSWPLLLP